MADQQSLGTQSATESDDSARQMSIETKRKLAKGLLEGTKKDQEKAVSLLEECVASGDSDAMLMLAKCCALGRGMEHDRERGAKLISQSAEKGNKEAQLLTKAIDEQKHSKQLSICGL